MTLYMTKVWGFGDPCGPLQFSTNGARETARSLLKDGDRVILVGTLGAPTLPNDQGRVLGMMEPTREPVASLDYGLEREEWDFDEEGNYKWPYGLHNRRAWKFAEPRLLLTDISSRAFYMDSAQGIVLMTAVEEAAVLKYPHHPVELLTPIRALARIDGEDAARRRNAPPPTTTRQGIMHLRRAPALTYAMAIEGAKFTSFKIGWAFDAKARERQFNQASMPKLGGLTYRTRLTEIWKTARLAYEMEQALLRKFDAIRHYANREIISGAEYPEIERAWIDYLALKKR
jgi:hypothetical protein